MKKVEVDETAALERYLTLTAIEGRSGEEKDVADAIVQFLVESGVDPDNMTFDGAETRTRLRGNCGNLIVRLPGAGTGPRTLLSAHMDTVPICVGCEPVVDGDQVVSRGETGLGADDRSGCAAIVTAAIERQRLGDDNFPPAVLVFFIQEEIGLQGSRTLDAQRVGPVDRAFNFDGGAIEKVTTGATGDERMDITLTGIPAHAGVAPENGASAIVMASRAIADLDARGWLGRVERPEGAGTSNVGVIAGGEATNVVTPQVTLRAEARSHDSDMRQRIVAEMKSAFEAAAAAVQNVDGRSGSCEFRSHVDYESFELQSDDPSVLAIEDALRNFGLEPYRKLAGGGLDANWLAEHGIRAVTVGCGQENIHTADERLSIRDFHDACRIAATLICQASG